MSLNIVCFYHELGRKKYQPLLRNMAASAKRVMPDCATALLTPTPETPAGQYFDKIYPLNGFVSSVETMFLDRARAVVSWAIQTKHPTVFCDADVEFQNPVAFGDYDVGLMYRRWWRDKPDQRVNAGMILARPGFEAFWRRYGMVVANLPPQLHQWWSDQMAFTLMVGNVREPGETVLIEGARVKLLDMDKHCTTPDRATTDIWAVHYKGNHKNEIDGIHPAES